MKVSVIIVCFNANHVVSTASQIRATPKLNISSLMAARRTVRFSEPDRGIYNAMNKGISRAAGEFVIFLNADDLFASPDALEVAMSEVKRLPDADVIYGGLHVREQSGTPPSSMTCPNGTKDA